MASSSSSALPSVLVVDDSALLRKLLSDIVAASGEFRVAGTARNGLDALRKVHALAPDLVTMDITMPEMNGLEALKAIRDHDPEARVLMVSAMGQQKMIVEALEAGVTGSLTLFSSSLKAASATAASAS